LGLFVFLQEIAFLIGMGLGIFTPEIVRVGIVFIIAMVKALVLAKEIDFFKAFFTKTWWQVSLTSFH